MVDWLIEWFDLIWCDVIGWLIELIWFDVIWSFDWLFWFDLIWFNVFDLINWLIHWLIWCDLIWFINPSLRNSEFRNNKLRKRITFPAQQLPTLTSKSLSQSIIFENLHGNGHWNHCLNQYDPKAYMEMDIEITFPVLQLPELTSTWTSKSLSQWCASQNWVQNWHWNHLLSQ